RYGAARRRCAPEACLCRKAAGARLQRLIVRLARADAKYAFQLRDENLAVAHLAGLGSADDRLDHLIDQAVAYRDLDTRLGHEVHDIFRAPVQLGMPSLAAETL